MFTVYNILKIMHKIPRENFFDMVYWRVKKILAVYLEFRSNRPTAEKANFESSVGLVFNLLSVKVFDKNRKIWKYE